MRPVFSQCAILQCDTTRIGQDAPCGAMPKLIHPSIPGPWRAPSLASWKTWQVLGRQGGTWAGRLHLAQQGRVQTGLGRVESSRVWLTDSVGQSITSSPATDALEIGAEYFPHLVRFAAPRHASTEEALVTRGPALLQARSQP